jgi:hypothetical protein|tara:strand:- start:859 stop:1242 length:384 start_codon:yes stop_codon:yes gene_type:complete
MEFFHVSPKNALLRNKQKNRIIAGIHAKIVDEHPDFKKLSRDLNLLNLVANIIENNIDNKNKKIRIDKLEIVYEVYQRLYGNLTEDDRLFYKEQIEYLLEINKIKKIPMWKKVVKVMMNFLEKKLFG